MQPEHQQSIVKTSDALLVKQNNNSSSKPIQTLPIEHPQILSQMQPSKGSAEIIMQSSLHTSNSPQFTSSIQNKRSPIKVMEPPQYISEIKPRVYSYQPQESFPLNNNQAPSNYQNSVIYRDEIAEIFDSIDVDHNGLISVNEFHLILTKLNKTFARNYNEDDLKLFFSKLDVNRDGQLNLREFREAFNGIINRSQLQVFQEDTAGMFASDLLGNIFAYIDINHDGYISYQEAINMFKQINKQMGRHYSENDVNKFFADLDLNSDGRISFQEFREGFKRLL